MESTQSLGEVHRFLKRPPLPREGGERAMRYRMVYLLAEMRGEVVSIKTTNGSEIEGVFHCMDFMNETVTLKMAKILGNQKGRNSSSYKDVEKIKLGDLVCLQVVGSKFQRRAQQGFMTDTQISGSKKGSRRELQRWQPEDPTDDEQDPLGSLSHPNTSSGRWDQFAANEKVILPRLYHVHAEKRGKIMGSRWLWIRGRCLIEIPWSFTGYEYRTCVEKHFVVMLRNSREVCVGVIHAAFRDTERGMSGRYM